MLNVNTRVVHELAAIDTIALRDQLHRADARLIYIM